MNRAKNLPVITQMYRITDVAAQHPDDIIVRMTHSSAFPRAGRGSARSTGCGSTPTLAGGPVNWVLPPRAEIVTDAPRRGLLGKAGR